MANTVSFIGVSAMTGTARESAVDAIKRKQQRSFQIRFLIFSTFLYMVAGKRRGKTVGLLPPLFLPGFIPCGNRKRQTVPSSAALFADTNVHRFFTFHE
jgi:hypothetical protein